MEKVCSLSNLKFMEFRKQGMLLTVAGDIFLADVAEGESVCKWKEGLWLPLCVWSWATEVKTLVML